MQVLKCFEDNLEVKWETKYVIILWLSSLSLIPFDLKSFDSSSLDSTTRSTDDNKFVKGLISTLKTFLRDPGPTREAAGICLSTLLVRPELDVYFLKEFILWSITEIENFDVSSISFQFLVIGILFTIARVFKRGNRERILSVVFQTEQLLPIFFQLLNAENNSLIRKFICKLSQRIGLIHLPPKIASWRYSRGQRKLIVNQNHSTVNKSFYDIVKNSEVLGEFDNFVISNEIENIVDILLNFLIDKDTIVRWSAAKGLGRISMRLPKELADDIINAILQLFEDSDNDFNWHGGCLALAELVRRGLLLPEKLPKVIPIIENALVFDIYKGQNGIGANVRDSACYVCWAFARAYTPRDLLPFMKQLTSKLLITSLFDREINCRRAASAALQENIGRQGLENFDNGLSIISIIDYFNVGNRSNCYISLASNISVLDSNFFDYFVEHLLAVKLEHWDPEIRDISAKSLCKLIEINSFKANFVLKLLLKNCLSDNISRRHGALLSLAGMLHISISKFTIDQENLISIEQLVPTIEKLRLYRGKNGEMIRESVCFVLENMALADFPLSIKSQILLVEVLNEQIKLPYISVQLAASNALRAFLFKYFSNSIELTDPSERLQQLTTLKYIDLLSKTQENVAFTRGYLLALGSLPERLALLPVGRFDKIISTIDEFSNSNKKIGGDYDAESCRNAVLACVELTEKLIFSEYYSPDNLTQCLKILLKSCENYSIDKRGDTGSWSRIAAIVGLERIFLTIFQKSNLTPKFRANQIVKTWVGMAILENQVQDNFTVSFLPYTLGYNYIDKFDSFYNFSVQKHFNIKKRNLYISFVQDTSTFDLPLLFRLFSEYLGNLLKLMSEKLDNVREIAGTIFQRLLLFLANFSDNNEVIDSDILLFHVHKISDTFHWASPSQVFPFITNFFESNFFFKYLFCGIITSIGGLTEDIVNYSTKSFVELCKNHFDNKNSIFFQQIIETSESLFDIYNNDDRIIIPLFKTLCLLIKNGFFNCLDPICNQKWAESIYSVLTIHVKTQNITKLILIVDLLSLSFHSFHEFIRIKSLRSLINFLNHKFPRVRKGKCYFFSFFLLV